MKYINVIDIVYNHKRCFILINKKETDENSLKYLYKAVLELEETAIPIEIDIFKRYKLQGKYVWILESKTERLNDFINYPFRERNVRLKYEN